jgi:hypothetical protein
MEVISTEHNCKPKSNQMHVCVSFDIEQITMLSFTKLTLNTLLKKKLRSTRLIEIVYKY